MVSGSGHKAAVLGAGSWGTALAIQLGSVGHDVVLWGRDQSLIDEIAARRANPTYLPDITLPNSVRPTALLQDALTDARHVIMAVPSHGMRGVLRSAASHIPRGA